MSDSSDSSEPPPPDIEDEDSTVEGEYLMISEEIELPNNTSVNKGNFDNIISNSEKFNNNKNIIYEKFENAEGVYDASYNAASFDTNQQINTTDYAQVKYTGLVNANPNDIIQIEGTDLLTAPLVDNMLYINSISNTNRNASHDLRGDLSLTFNENYTPFYSSVIYGAPLSQKIMTLGSLESSG